MPYAYYPQGYLAYVWQIIGDVRGTDKVDLRLDAN